jgi:recombination protein RecR
MSRLLERVREQTPDEVILATNLTVEGEATAHYIHDLLSAHVATITRIAHGVPLGGELEYIDGGTIVHAMQGRRDFS